MSTVYYLTHPDVEIDPSTPVPRWHLSAVGRARARAACLLPWMSSVECVITSDETKARETASILSGHLGFPVEVRPGSGENDRSATGFVPPDRFDALADRFFAQPDQRVEGWERAVDAQARIVAELSDLLSPGRPVTLVVGHGGVGTLWYCHLAGLAIDRRHDQPGQGHYFAVDVRSGRPTHRWRPIDR